MDITNGIDMSLDIKEHIIFGNFDSREYGMRLIDRSAPSPSEKTMKESVPFAHGDYDFSFILGERMYENRPLTYTFHVHQHDYERRKHTQTALENELMRQGIANIIDSYSPGYHYNGKCVGVDTTDDHVYNRLIVNIEFDCYPFKVSQLPEGHDIWDEFNFELDVAQLTEYEIDGTKTITLYNGGAVSIVPTITASSEFEIQKGNITITVSAGTHKSELLRLNTGDNELTITGNGTIEFDFYKELI